RRSDPSRRTHTRVSASLDLGLRLLAVGAGAILYGLAFPPHDHAALAWVALVPLLLVVRGRSTWNAFLCGVAYGFTCSATVAGSRRGLHGSSSSRPSPACWWAPSTVSRSGGSSSDSSPPARRACSRLIGR